MNGLFKKTWISLIFNFIFICCYHIHTVHGVYSCVSPYPVPDAEFERENYENVSFVRNVVVELARRLHVTLGLNQPINLCDELASIATTFVYNEKEYEYPRDIENEVSVEMMQTIEITATRLFDYFISIKGFMDRTLNETKRRTIYESVDTAIHHLLRSGNYFISSPLIATIRNVKNYYCPGCQLLGLLINNQIPPEVPTTPQVLFDNYPSIRTNTGQFKSKRRKDFGATNLLYVGQDEMAVTKSDDPNVVILGSDNASTCIIVILKHTGADVYGLVHLDENENIPTAIRRLVEKVLTVSGNTAGILELRLVGGYSDTKYVGERIFFAIMQAIQKESVCIYLVFACVGSQNTNTQGNESMPIIDGAGINIKNGDIHPARFSDKGPDRALREARIIGRNYDVIDIYNHTWGFIEIGPFHYEVWFNVQHMLNKSDDDLDQEFGSTPNYSSSSFVRRIREALEFLKENPDPARVFPNNRPRRFKRNSRTNLWIKV